MKVLLTYFRPNGKYYAEAEYTTRLKDLWVIWEEVELFQMKGRLPGLVENAREFIILISVPEHEHNHPRLIVNPGLY